MKPESATLADPRAEMAAKETGKENPSKATPMDAGTRRAIALGELRPSPLNPRKHFDEKYLAELAESFKLQGQLQPAVVRPIKPGGLAGPVRYEIAIGECRFRAAKLAGLATLDCIVRELSDVAVLEMNMIEQAKRRDIMPLEEAAGFELLMRKAKYDAKALAEKIHTSLSYVYMSLKLLDAIEPVREALEKGTITAGHARLISRLNPEQQGKAFRACISDKDDPLSVRNLQGWISQNFELALERAPWKLDDKELLAGAGACTICPHNTASDALLFADKSQPLCLQGSCYQKKLAAHIKAKSAELKHAGEQLVKISTEYQSSAAGGVLGNDKWTAAKPDCKEKMKGIVVPSKYRESDDHPAGEVLDVCVNPRCKVCHPGYGGDESSKPLSEREKKLRAAEVEKQKRETKLRELKEDARRRALTAILAKVKAPLAGADLRLVVEEIVESGEDYGRYDKDILQAMGEDSKGAKMGLPGRKDDELARIALAWALLRDVDGFEEAKALKATAARYKVDLDAIEKQVRADAAGVSAQKDGETAKRSKDPDRIPAIVIAKKVKAAKNKRVQVGPKKTKGKR